MIRYGRHRRVLVLGDDTRSFLTVIRSLGRLGLEVHVAWCSWNAPATQSRFVKHVHWIQTPRLDARASIEELKKLLNECPFDLIIPCADDAILPLQMYRDQLLKFPLMLVPSHAFTVFSDKGLTHDLAARHSVPLPRQASAHTIAEVEHHAASFGYPVVLKPPSSVTIGDLRKHHVYKAWNLETLRSVAEPMLAKGPILIEQHVRGAGEGIEVICDDGEVLTAFQHRRVHEPLDGGGSSYRVSVPLQADMLDAVRRLMAATRYTGVGMVEFKVPRDRHDWALIEVNARFWGSLALSVGAGLDFPRFAYELQVLGRRDFPQAYRVGLYARHWVSDIYWMKANFRADRHNPDLHTEPLAVVARELLHMPMGREVSDSFRWDDPRPAVAEVVALVAPRLRTRVRKVSVIRRVMQARARRLLQHASNVIVVCKGNICRSPFAAALLRARRLNVVVHSAGTLGPSGRTSPEESWHAAAPYGVDLSAHRSSLLSRTHLETADVVIVFDEEHEAFIRSTYPEAAKKLVFCGAMNSRGPLYIDDPWGKAPSAFRLCYEQIASALDF